MREIIRRHKFHWSNKFSFKSTVWAFLFFVASLIFNNFANNYTVLTSQNSVPDIILSNVRVFDVDFIVNYGPVLIIILIGLILFTRPAAIPFTIKTLALFIAIRAMFITMTHLGQFQPQLILPTNGFFNFIGGGNTGGLFFSGHTGVPLLIAFIFWDTKILRYGFFALSILLGVAMLLAHLHYTIDVVGAIFITPTIYHLATRLFKKDFLLV